MCLTMYLTMFSFVLSCFSKYVNVKLLSAYVIIIVLLLGFVLSLPKVLCRAWHVLLAQTLLLQASIGRYFIEQIKWRND